MSKLKLLWRELTTRRCCGRCNHKRPKGPWVLAMDDFGTGMQLICWNCHIIQATRRDSVVRQVRGQGIRPSVEQIIKAREAMEQTSPL